MPNLGHNFASAGAVVTVAPGNRIDVYKLGSPGAVDYERLRVDAAGNFKLQVQKGGTGAGRHLELFAVDGSGFQIAEFSSGALKGTAGGYYHLRADVGVSLRGDITTQNQALVRTLNNTFGTSFSAASGEQQSLLVQEATNQTGSAQFVLIKGLHTKAAGHTSTGRIDLLRLLSGASGAEAAKFSVDDGGRVDSVSGVALQTPAASRAADYTLTEDDFFVRFTTDVARTANLPAAAAVRGQVYAIRAVGANAVTIDPNGAETIDGAATATVAANTCRMIQSDGVGWVTVGTMT